MSVGKSFEDMLENLEKVFKRLHQTDVKLKAKKCNLFAKKVSYLEHRRILLIDRFHVISWKFVLSWNFGATIGASSETFLSLQNLCMDSKIGRKCTRTKETQEAFENLPNQLISAPMLALPAVTKQIILDIDDSENSKGAVC